MTERPCTKCGITKPLEAFKAGKGYHDGHQRQCRECVGARRRERYRENPQPETEKAKIWTAANRPKRLEIERRYNATHPEQVERKVQRLHDRTTPEEYAANTALHHAIRAGKVARPNSCEQCGKECKPEGAHFDYRPENALRVRWLCRGCHVKWDQAEPKATHR